MERKPVLVGLKNGRVTALSIDTSNEERLSFIENGCDSVILMPENSDVPDFKVEYEIKFVDKSTPEGFVLVPKEPSADLVNHGHQVFLGHFNEGGQTGGRSLYFAYKAMIEAQEQGHE